MDKKISIYYKDEDSLMKLVRPNEEDYQEMDQKRIMSYSLVVSRDTLYKSIYLFDGSETFKEMKDVREKYDGNGTFVIKRDTLIQEYHDEGWTVFTHNDYGYIDESEADESLEVMELKDL